MESVNDIRNDPDRLDPWAELPPLRTWCKIGGRLAIPREGIISISAKRKQGKSYFCYALALALISGKPFGNIEPLAEPNFVMVFDTEMDRATLQERMRSVLRQVGKDNQGLQVFPILSVEKDKRLPFIQDKVALYDPEIIVVDGIADLIANFNDAEESLSVMEDLLRLAVGRTVVCIIHQNKALTDENMRGHLGTNLGNKAIENYSVKRSGGVFQVTCVDSRFSDPESGEDFKFALTEDGDIITTESVLAKENDRKTLELKEEFQEIFSDGLPLKYVDIAKKVAERSGCSSTLAKAKVTEAKKMGIIKKMGGERCSPYELC
jgi:hypothetical protein